MNDDIMLYWVTTSAATNAVSTVTVNYPNTQTGSSLLGGELYQYQNLPQMYQTSTQTDNWISSLAGMQYLWNTGNYNPRNMIQHMQLDEPTAEEIAKLKERAAKREAAEARAQKLLFTILTPRQVKQYTDDDYFEVPVGERLYRLRKGKSMNVELMEAGKATIKFCAHPQDAHDLPVPDVMLSQLLALRSNEAEFLRIANRTVLQ